MEEEQQNMDAEDKIYYFSPDKLEFLDRKAVKEAFEEIFGGKSLEFIGFSDSGSLEGIGNVFPSLLGYIIHLYRIHSKKFSQSIFGTEQQLLAIQLAMAKINKQATGEFSVTRQEVLDSHEKLMNYKLDTGDGSSGVCMSLLQAYNEFLELCNAVDYTDVCNDLKKNNHFGNTMKPLILSTDYSCTELERELMNHLLKGRTTQCLTLEEKEGSIHLVTGDVKDFITTLKQAPATPSSLLSTPQEKCQRPNLDIEKIQPQVLRVFLSYLRLLVNSRDELALAHVINIPFRELGVRQFADIRRHARDKKMPMFQTILSFMMQKRLGGKGYAPDNNCPLQPHTKGLGEFVSLINKLQNTLEEETKSSFAVQKIFNTIKIAMLKDKKCCFTEESVQNALQYLRCTIKKATLVCKTETTQSTIIGLPTLQLIQAVVDYNTFLDDKPRQNAACCLSTPLLESGMKSRVSSLLTSFRTPEPVAPDEAESSPVHKRDKKSEKRYPPCRSDFAWAPVPVSLTPLSIKRKTLCDSSEQPEVQVVDAVTDTDIANESLVWFDREDTSCKPKTKKIALESVYDKENVSSINCKATSSGKRAPKTASRQILQDKTNQKVKKNNKTNTRKKINKLVVPADQKRLTQFFR